MKYKHKNWKKALIVALALATSVNVTACGRQVPAASVSGDVGGTLARENQTPGTDAPEVITAQTFANAAAGAAGAASAAGASAQTVQTATSAGSTTTTGAPSPEATATATAAATASAAAKAEKAKPIPAIMDFDTAVAIHIDSSSAVVNAGKAADVKDTVDIAARDISSKNPSFTAYLKNSKTYVPLSFIEEVFGVESEAGVITSALRLNGDGKRFTTLRSSEYDVASDNDGLVIETFVPLRTVAEKLNKVIWFDDGLILIGDAPKANQAELKAETVEALRLSLVGVRAVGSAKRLDELLSSSYQPVAYLGSHSGLSSWMKNGVWEVADSSPDFLFDASSAQPAAAEESGQADRGDRGGGTGASTTASGAASGASSAPASGAASAPAPQPTSAAPPVTLPITPGGTDVAINGDVPAVDDFAAGESGADAETAATDDYSRTNTQVEGVDESDIVKTDGKYIYYVNDMRVLIVEAYPPENMRVVGRVDYADSGAASQSFARDYPTGNETTNATGNKAGTGTSGSDGSGSNALPSHSAFAPHEIYVDGDRLVVIGTSLRNVIKKPRAATGAPSGEATEANAAQDAETDANINAATDANINAATADSAAPAVAAPTAAPTLSVTQTADARRVFTAADVDYDGGYYDSDPFEDTTLLLVYDISDRSNPVLSRETEIDGVYNTSRKIGASVYVVTNKYNYDYTNDGSYSYDVMYRDLSSSPKTSEPTPFSRVPYDRMFYFPGQVSSYSYLVVAGVDIVDAKKPASVEAILNGAGDVYASQNNLYVAIREFTTEQMSPAYDGPAADANAYFNLVESTALHRFALDGGNVVYDGRGEVPGTINNQFSMDQNGEWFRVATTTRGHDINRGYYMSNNLYVLDSDLSVAGRLEDLAPDETIYSARFIGDRAYVVTFKTVDPLFVIDLSNPYAPTVLGALKIPGYSDYLHPYDENHIIGFGKDAVVYQNEWDGGTSETAYYQGMKVALFDVSDVANPKELWNTSIGDRGTDSELLRNHKALLFSKERNLLAFPVTLMEVTDSQKTGDPKRDSLNYGMFSYQGLYVYNLDIETGFTLRGRLTHLSESDLLKSGTYGAYGDEAYEKHIDRALYVKDTLYALSGKYISAADFATLGERGKLDVAR